MSKLMALVVAIIAFTGSTAFADEPVITTGAMMEDGRMCAVEFEMDEETYRPRWDGGCVEGHAQGLGTLTIVNVDNDSVVTISGAFDHGALQKTGVARYVDAKGNENICSLSEGKDVCWSSQHGAYWQGNLMRK